MFGLTTHMDTVQQHYVNWIEMALNYNPNTAFFIGMSWHLESLSLGSTTIDLVSNAHKDGLLESVSELREMYPNNQLFVIVYGKAASTTRVEYKNQNIPGITAAVGDRETSTHRDTGGHASAMLVEVCALSWLEILYGADVNIA